VSHRAPLTLALTRGRILKDCLPLLAAAGIVPEEDPGSSRKLVIGTNRSDLRLLVLRGPMSRSTCATVPPMPVWWGATFCSNPVVMDSTSRSISASRAVV
jgi:hypothetical protein